jgi:hypothetical protein
MKDNANCKGKALKSTHISDDCSGISGCWHNPFSQLSKKQKPTIL